MAGNGDTRATWAYHDATKHSPTSVRSGGHVLDRTNQPRPWKLYVDELPTVGLSRNVAPSGVSTLEAIGGRARAPRPSLTLDDLGAVLLLSAGITKTLMVPGGQMRFRAAACTGALYHIELYVVTRGLDGLPAGVYHYGVHDNSLRRLREGDHRGALAKATANDPAAGSAEAFLVYTSTYWRNAWKYASRAYRHAFWDAGTVIANTLAVAGARDLSPSVLTGFVDEDVNRLIGVDPDHEASVAIVTLGTDGERRPSSPRTAGLHLAEEPVSRSEIDFPLIREMHRASSMSVGDLRGWAGSGRPSKLSAPGAAIDLPSPLAPTKGIEETILKRGSSRRFDGLPIANEAFATVLGSALGRVPLDATAEDEGALADAFVIVNAVEGLAPGAYVYDSDAGTLRRLRDGDPRQDASHLALDQALGGDAAFNIYFLADLPALLRQLGNRAYRAALLDASIAAGRAYLAAYALGLGATGLTFYDDEVIEFFGECARGMSVMFLLAVGNPARRS